MRDYWLFVEDLRKMISEDGELETDGFNAHSRVSILARDGRRFMFDADLGQVRSAVERTDADGSFGGSDGSLRLFSVHVMEALETASFGATRLELREYGVVAT